MTAADVIDTAIEVPVVTSFTRIGNGVRSRTDRWKDLATYDLAGRVVVLTGATSGLGLAGAHRLAAAGATLVLLGRNAEKTALVRDDIAAATGNQEITTVIADMGDLEQVRAAAAELATRHDRLDVLIHNAGTLSSDRRESAQGLESTIASQVVGPTLLTTLLLDRLRAAAPGRVITMSSGGMYGARLTVSDLEMDPSDYGGTEQYARAKRAQVTLNEMWAQRIDPSDIVFHTLHPGWADTPGVAESLPTFRRIVGPFLRTPDEGADTMVWLAADDGAPLETTGRFWSDRRPRSIHKLGTTRRSDTPQRRRRLWESVEQATTR